MSQQTALRCQSRHQVSHCLCQCDSPSATLVKYEDKRLSKLNTYSGVPGNCRITTSGRMKNIIYTCVRKNTVRSRTFSFSVWLRSAIRYWISTPIKKCYHVVQEFFVVNFDEVFIKWSRFKNGEISRRLGQYSDMWRPWHMLVSFQQPLQGRNSSCLPFPLKYSNSDHFV